MYDGVGGAFHEPGSWQRAAEMLFLPATCPGTCDPEKRVPKDMLSAWPLLCRAGLHAPCSAGSELMA